MQYPQIDKYADMDSAIHRWDPRAKLVAMLCLIFSIVLIPDARVALGGLLVAVFLLLISRLPLNFVAKRLIWVGLFILPLFMLILLTHSEGHEIVRFSFLAITSDGLEAAVLIVARAMAAVMLTLCMVGTMRFETTIKALESLKVPTKLTQLIMFTYRYIFALIDEFHGMSRSLASRGFNRGMSVHTLTTIAKVIAILFVRSHERAERVYHAMVSRGYEGNVETTIEFRMHKMDVAKAATLVVVGLSLNLSCLMVA